MSIVKKTDFLSLSNWPIHITVLIGGVLSPLVSLVALPIFACMSAVRGIQHSFLYKRTLTNGARADFGRVEGQDYRRWNGKVIQLNEDFASKERHYMKLGECYHRQDDYSFFEKVKKKGKAITECPFNKQEDLDWLNKELERKKVEKCFEENKKMASIFWKTLIPFFGIFWLLTRKNHTLSTCGTCLEVLHEGKIWKLKSAINFHRKSLATQLGQPIPSKKVSVQKAPVKAEYQNKYISNGYKGSSKPGMNYYS